MDTNEEKMTKEQFLEGCRDALSGEGIDKLLEAKGEAVELANELGAFDPILGQMIHDFINESERRFEEIRDHLKRKIQE